MSKGLFVGLCGMDVVFYENKPLPQEDVKMKVSDVRSCIGGPAANAAITNALLGGESTVVSYIGNSPIGLVIKQLMAGYGIKVIDMCEDTDVKCISSIYVNTGNATRTILSGRNAIHQLKDKAILKELIQEHDYVLYDGHFPQLDDVLLPTVEETQTPLVIDVGGWKDTFNLILCHHPILICSQVFRDEDRKDGIDLMEKFGMKHVAITRGPRPVLYKTDHMAQRQEIEVPKVNAIDTLGAGDIFHGAFCYFMFEKHLDFEGALAKACDVASTSTTVYGVVDGVKCYLSQMGGESV